MKSLQLMLRACVALGAALVVACGGSTSGGSTTETVATPVISPAAGSYDTAQSVTITTTTTDATIYYEMTSDGGTPADPTASSPPYTAAIPLAVPASGSTTYRIKAIALKDGWNDSAIASATYTLALDVVASPSFSPTPGTFSAGQSVTIATTTSGASIYYTMTSDGSTPADPTTSSTPYEDPIAIVLPGSGTKVYTFKAIAVNGGMASSAVTTATYTLVATTVLASDFESGPTSYPIIGGTTPGVLNAAVVPIGNVLVSAGTAGATTGNSSAHVLEVGSDGYNQYARLPATLPAGKTLADYGYACVKALFPNNGGDNGYKSIYVFAGTTLTDAYHATTEALGSSTSTGGMGTTWNTYCIPLDPTKAAAVTGTSIEIALGISRSGTAAGPYYLDDVTLLPAPEANSGFETDVAGTTTYPIIGGATPGVLNAQVIAIGNVLVSAGTTGATTGNSSANVLAVGSDNYNQYARLPLTLPAGSLSDYAYVRVRAVFPNNGGDNGYKSINVFIDTTITDGYHATTEAVGSSISTGGSGTAWKEFLIPIDPAKAAAVSGTALQIALGINRSGTAAGPYYLDDVALVHK